MSGFYYQQPTAAQLQKRIEEAKAKAAKKGKHYEPVVVQHKGRQLCHTWWAQAWCENMETYLDYENRLARGRRYARNGSILDLKIAKGKVTAKVQGSRPRPYTVTIDIDPLSESAQQALLERCTAKITSLDALVQGQFPAALKDVFTQQGGLFPGPDEIHFHCSCPDWAYMCKHVAAVMFGIGIRLDENPLYFFELRGMDPSLLVRKSVENKVEALLANANCASSRILQEDAEKIDALFGLE